MIKLKYWNDYTMLEPSNPWEWWQTVLVKPLCLAIKINSKTFFIPLPFIFPKEPSVKFYDEWGKWWECGSDQKCLWLAFLPSLNQEWF